jgi:hypothetical protein
VKNAEDFRILVLADIVGRPGRKALNTLLRSVLQDFEIDFCVANGENAAGGFGLTPSICERLFELGVDVITTGNHVWDRKEIIPYLDESDRVLRPLNFPEENPGKGIGVFESRSGVPVTVINAQGRVFMTESDCPFRAIDRGLELTGSRSSIRVVDFHAEATSEKMAMGWYLDGRVTAVLGTHTHVPTADDRILPGGTAYMTDMGMTGAQDSVIGIEKTQAVTRFVTLMPQRFTPAKYGISLCGVLIKARRDGNATSISRVNIQLEDGSE